MSNRRARCPSRTIAAGDGRRTSVRLEPEFWAALDDICRREGLTLSDLCHRIDRTRRTGLTAALRLHVVAYFRQLADK